jgi:rhodanese-related sulfurtransferase
VLLKEEKKKKRRGSTKEEDEEEEARRSVSSVSGIYDERIASVYDLLQNLTTQRLQVIDTRSEALFLGKVRRGAKTGPSSKNGGVDRAGHIPSSINVPHSRLRPFDNEHNIAIFEDRGVDVSAPCAVIGEQRCSSAPFVAAMLENLGLKEVFIVESGVRAWRCEDGGSYPLFNPSTDSSSKGRVLVWSVTRGRSTALERAFAQHPKIMVMHELLTEPYLKENTPDNYEKIKNGQQTLNVSSSGCSYASVMELMMTDYSSQGKPYYLCKELSCYFDEEKCTDEWLLGFHHVILVRNPSDALKSFYRVGLNNAVAESLYFDPSESGFKECQKIVERLDRIKGKYMVVDADLDLMANPEGTLKQICAFSSIAFSKNMLSWEPKELDSWKKFRGWHTDAVNSTELKAPVRSESFELADYPKEVFTAVEEAMPYYTFCIKRR